ncbi:MAG TPA: hypothetical protein VGK22_02535 [Candidatus Angelobacter sp.]|jgi:hypothetical protein
MNQQEWERDVRNRQRNIVFPDTNLNEGRFYRNIASGKAVFSRGQKVSLLVIVALFMMVNAVDFASNLGAFVNGDRRVVHISVPWPAIGSLLWLLFWIFLAVKALFPPAPRMRKRRGGYLTSRRG